jgi:hypothetical protein
LNQNRRRLGIPRDSRSSETALATDMFEHNLKKLNQLYQQGGESYAKREAYVKALLI